MHYGTLMIVLLTAANIPPPTDASASDASFREKLEQLRAFKAHEGHADVPRDHPDQLGRWLAGARRAARTGALAPERAAALAALGVKWRPLEGDADDAWDEGLALPTEFAAREGHARPPRGHVERGAQ